MIYVEVIDPSGFNNWKLEHVVELIIESVMGIILTNSVLKEC